MDANFMANHNRQVRDVNTDFAAKRTANTFSRTLSQRRGSRQVGDFQQNFQRQAPRLTTNFARRGMGNSGVYQKAMQRFTGDYSRDLGRMFEDQAAQDYQFDLNDQQFVSERDRLLSDLELQKARQIALTAQHINGLRPYMG